MPRNGGGYRINCNVSRHTAYPIHQRIRASLLYRNPDGTRPEVPEGHLVGDRFVATRSYGHRVQWKRLYRPLEHGSEDEVLVFLWRTRRFFTTSARRGGWRDGTAR
jgi:hypothetical protein